MPTPISSTKDLLVVIPRFIRNWVRSSTVEKNLSVTVCIANAAIDFVENLGKPGEIAMSADLTKGAQNWA